MYKSRFVDFYNFIKPQIKHKHTIILQNICDLLSGKLPYIYKSNGKISVIKSIMQGVGFCEMIVRRLIPEWVSMYNDYLIENPITYDIEPIKVIETKDNRKILPEKCWYNEQGNIVRSCRGCGNHVVYKNDKRGWDKLRRALKENRLCRKCFKLGKINEDKMWQNADGKWCRKCPDCKHTVKYKLGGQSRTNCRHAVEQNKKCHQCCQKKVI